MKRMSVITPSFAPDFELCADAPPHRRASDGSQAVPSTRRSTYAHPLRKRPPAPIVRPSTVKNRRTVASSSRAHPFRWKLGITPDWRLARCIGD